MTVPDYSEFTREEIAAERAALAAERAALSGDLPEVRVTETLLAGTDDIPFPLSTDTPEDLAPKPEVDEAPAPWPHAHMEYGGLSLEVRIPDQAALVAISMLEMLDGNGSAQIDIFNTFLFNHLSPTSMVTVIKKLTNPDTDITLQGLVQALVHLRTKASSDL